MDAKSPAPCTLRVECLESRLLPSPINLLPGERRVTAPSDSYEAALVQTGGTAPTSSPPDRDDDDGDEESALAAGNPAGDPGAVTRYLQPGGRDSDYDTRAERQLLHDESRERAAHEYAQIAPAVVVVSAAPPANGEASAAPPPILAVNALAAPAPAPAGDMAAATNLARPEAPAPEVSTLGDGATCSDSRPAAASGPPEAAPADSSTLPDWRDALDFLAGIPVADAVPLDAAAMRAEADAFLSRVAGLVPDWAGDLDWEGYVWLAAGVLLAGGGVQFARAARRPRGVPGPHLSRSPAEGSP